jgi:hypothetical protein
MAHGTSIDPSKTHAPDRRGPEFKCNEPCCNPATPGGNTTLIEGDEKARLDGYILSIAQRVSTGYMSSSHDAHKVGIYTTNSVGDDD